MSVVNPLMWPPLHNISTSADIFEKEYKDLLNLFPNEFRDAIFVFLNNFREEVVIPLLIFEPKLLSSSFIELHNKYYVFLNTLSISFNEFITSKQAFDDQILEKINKAELRIFDAIIDLLIQKEDINNVEFLIDKLALLLDHDHWIRNEYLKNKQIFNKLMTIPEFTKMEEHYHRLILCTSSILYFILKGSEESFLLKHVDIIDKNISILSSWSKEYYKQLDSYLDTLTILIDEKMTDELNKAISQARSQKKG